GMPCQGVERQGPGCEALVGRVPRRNGRESRVGGYCRVRRPRRVEHGTARTGRGAVLEGGDYSELAPCGPEGGEGQVSPRPQGRCGPALSVPRPVTGCRPCPARGPQGRERPGPPPRC